jgi:predicted Zn-dependent protease
VIQQVYGVGSQMGFILPFSRTHELEADKLGLIFMALAGYDPAASIDFWMRMAASDASKPPEFLSTHPADETRIEQIRAYLPEAMQFYRP